MSELETRRKKVIGRAMIVFLGVLLLLTFFSNTINNFSLPKVKAEYTTSGSLTKEITGTGVVQAKGEESIYIQSNLLVLTSNVKVGDRVKKGQLLFTLDTGDISEQLANERDRLEQRKLNLEKLMEADTVSDLTSYDIAIETARAVMDNSKRNLDNIEAQYQAGTETADNYQTAKVNYENAKKEYDLAVNNKASVMSNNEKELRNKQRDIRNAQLDIKIEERTITQLEEQLKLNKITAPFDGIISEVNFSEGSMVNNAKALYKLTEDSKGYQFNATVDADSAAYLAVGDEAEVAIDSLNGTILDGKVNQIVDHPQQGDKKILIIDIPPDGLMGGESGIIHIEKNIANYPALIPNSALAQDSKGYFVYVLQERRGPVGNEYYVQKGYITVNDSDDEKTAVISGLDYSERVVIATDKALAEGARVALRE